MTVAGTLAVVGVALLAAVAIAARPDDRAAPARGDGTVCPAAGKPAAQASTKELRKSVRCLIKDERSNRGLDVLGRDQSLAEAAALHSEAMVEADCLAHQCSGEDDLATRLRDAGYFDGAEMWQFAENTGCGMSAEAMVANWMATRFHRVNILEPRFHEIGVGVVGERVKGRCEKGYATFTVVVAWNDADDNS